MPNTGGRGIIDIASALSNLTQDQLDDWLSCRIRVSEIVRKNMGLARMFRVRILTEIEKYTPEGLLKELQRRRPDIHIRDRNAAIAKIKEELQDIRQLLE
ncbi:MAG: hypothetical protein KAW39_03095 [Thermoplasmata archaeon]|nr:hypothetical protein [Thermoplasmata archaeon]